MNKLNKMLFLFFILLFLILNTLSINFSSEKVSMFVYRYNVIFWIINISFVILFFYFFLLLSFGSFHKKFFSTFLKVKEYQSPEIQKIGKALFLMLVMSLSMFIFSTTGITIFTGHKCLDNKIENCRIDTKTLRSLYIPDFTALFLKKTEHLSEFEREYIVYFSSRIKNEDYLSLVFLLFFLIPVMFLKYENRSLNK